MSGQHPRGMRERDERAHPVMQDALDRGYLDTGAAYRVDGLAGHEAANRARMSVNRCRNHFGVSVSCWVVNDTGEPCHKGCQDPAASHGIRFRVHSRNSARTHIWQQSGGDPAKLRYNPFGKRTGPAFDDDGNRLA